MPPRQTQQGETSGDRDIEAGQVQDGNAARRSRSQRGGHGRTRSRTQSHLDPNADLPPEPERLAVTSQLPRFWMTKYGFLIAILIVLVIVGAIVGGVLGGRSGGDESTSQSKAATPTKTSFGGSGDISKTTASSIAVLSSTQTTTSHPETSTATPTT